MMWYDDTRQSSDYNAVWDVRTTVNGEGWIAEFRIPFKTLRFEAGDVVVVVGTRKGLDGVTAILADSDPDG